MTLQKKEKREDKQKEEHLFIGGINIKMATIIEVGEFTILWNIFENCILEEYKRSENEIKYNENYKITKMIEIAKKDTGNLLQSLEGFSVLLNSCATTVTDGNVEKYVKEKIFSNDDALRRVNETGKKVGVEIIQQIQVFVSNGAKDIDNRAGGFFAIWAIRNNIFHGSKKHFELDDQIELFKKMNAVLRAVV